MLLGHKQVVDPTAQGEAFDLFDGELLPTDGHGHLGDEAFGESAVMGNLADGLALLATAFAGT